MQLNRVILLVGALCVAATASYAQIRTAPDVLSSKAMSTSANECATSKQVLVTGGVVRVADRPYTNTISCKGTRVNCSTTWACCEKGGRCDKDGFASCN